MHLIADAIERLRTAFQAVWDYAWSLPWGVLAAIVIVMTAAAVTAAVCEHPAPVRNALVRAHYRAQHHRSRVIVFSALVAIIHLSATYSLGWRRGRFAARAIAETMTDHSATR